MRSQIRGLGVCVLLACSAGRVEALPPAEVFAKASPSVVVIETTDQHGKAAAQGSGVVVGPGLVVTNCHVLQGASSAEVVYGGNRYSAMPRHVDTDRDLCSLDATGLFAPTVLLGTSQLRIGEPVYTIGAPEGLELTIGQGLLSSRRGDGAYQLLQTTAPISHGSSGGGLFDESGRLIGITTMFLRDGQQLNFAVPAEWIAELPSRDAASSAAREATAAADAAVAAADAAAAAANEQAHDPESDPRWVFLFQYPDYAREADGETIEMLGSRIKGWVRDRYTTPSTVGATRGVSRAMMRFEFNCGARTGRISEVHLYSDAGEQLDSASDPYGQAKPIIPGTQGEELYNVLCQALSARQQ